MQLSKRLEAIMAMMPRGTVLADIGTDHGHVPVELLRRGLFSRAIASDVRKGPLKAAEKNVREAGLWDRIELRLGDGLHTVKPGEADCILIAGMGGPLMERILTEGMAAALAAKTLVLSPQSEIPHFRSFLQEAGFCIRDEAILEEDGKFYFLIKAEPGEGSAWQENDKLFGKINIEKNTETLKNFLRREVRIAEGVLAQLLAAESEAGILRKQETEQYLAACRTVLAEAGERTLAETRDFFDACAPRWDAEMIKDEMIVGEILDAAGVGPGKTVLDVACGTGVLFENYLERGAEKVTGIDLSPKMTAIAAEKFAGEAKVTVLTGDAEQTEFAERFDCVMVYNAFPHFEDAERLIRKLSALVRPGGTLSIAHGMSRERLRAHHGGAAARISHELMPAQELAELMKPFVRPEICLDNARMYLVTGRKISTEESK